jgi:hypothetical protein
MTPRLYRDLVSWYRLVDPPENHRSETACYQEAFERVVSPRPETLLELGAGAGHNASHLKRRFRCTLSDLSPDMLALSQALNPDCEHVPGDMRTLRLGRAFDVVLVHDAVTYMTTEEDLVAAIATAFAHTRPGGAALFAPDCLREDFRERSGVIAGEADGRAVRCLEWHWDPDPADDSYVVDFAFLLRDTDGIRTVHDRHFQGLFARERWLRLLAAAGYEAEPMARRQEGPGPVGTVFLCRRP